MINTQQNVVFHGERPLLARISTQKLIRVALEWPWGGLPDATGARGRGPTPNKIDIGVAKNRHKYGDMRDFIINVFSFVVYVTHSCHLMIIIVAGSQRFHFPRNPISILSI